MVFESQSNALSQTTSLQCYHGQAYKYSVFLQQYRCNPAIILAMQKEQDKLITKHQIKKDRVGGFPFHIVSTTYSTKDLHFIIAADNVAQVLSVYPFTSDMAKLITSTIPLTDILPKRLIATIHIISLTVKSHNNSSVVITHAEFILGYRSGHLVVVEYKDKECKMRERYNKSIKVESLFSRTTSALFGSDEHYNPYFTSPIRSFTVNSQLDCFIWQVGNNIFMQKQLNQAKQHQFLTRYEMLNLQNFHLKYDVNKVIKQGNILLYGCDQYTVMEYPELAITLIAFRCQVSSFTVLGERKELAVSLAANEALLILDFNHFMLKSKITTEMPIRRLSSFEAKGQTFLACMPYENYLILYSLSSNSYCKLKGHKSFLANTLLHNSKEKIITAGMDHQICLMRLSSIKQESWINAQKLPFGCWKIKEYGISQQKFDDVFRLVEENSTRSNLSSYGYADLFEVNGYYCFPTFDHRIIIYAL